MKVIKYVKCVYIEEEKDFTLERGCDGVPCCFLCKHLLECYNKADKSEAHDRPICILNKDNDDSFLCLGVLDDIQSLDGLDLALFKMGKLSIQIKPEILRKLLDAERKHK